MLKYDFPWLKNKDIKNLFKVFDKANIDARFVGGCIRDFLLGLDTYDLDIASTAKPEEIFILLNQNNFMVIPTGIEYGTVTVVFKDGSKVEITTLRQDIETDGRHTKVKYTNNWSQDAYRRDFTINALYVDINGTIYDPTGLGLQDIENKYVRFIGNSEDRIQEDYLRILRFFRFSTLCNNKIDPNSLSACLKYKNKLNLLSKERIKIELEKLLSYNNCYDIVLLMLENDIFDQLSSYLPFNDRFFMKIKNSGSWPLCNWLIRLVSLIDQEKLSLHQDSYRKSQSELIAYFLRKDLHLSNTETQQVKNMLQHLPEKLIYAVKQYNFSNNNYDMQYACLKIKKQAYHTNVIDILSALILNECDVNSFINLVDWEKPKLPINGLDIKNATNNEIITGTILRQVEKWWISHNFIPNRNDCMDYMMKLLEK